MDWIYSHKKTKKRLVNIPVKIPLSQLQSKHPAVVFVAAYCAECGHCSRGKVNNNILTGIQQWKTYIFLKDELQIK